MTVAAYRLVFVMEQILDTSQLARVLGTSRQRAAELAESPGFPEPQPSGGQGPLWARRAVERWAATAAGREAAPRP